jgi:hypothetical protein
MKHLRVIFLVTCCVLCLSVAVMWVRSHYVCDQVIFRRDRAPIAVETWSFVSLRGRVRLFRHLMDAQWTPGDVRPLVASRRWTRETSRRPVSPNDPTGPLFGFEHTKEERQGRYILDTMRIVWIPYWSLTTILAVPMLMAGYRGYRHSRRVAAGHCNCGYDLRASKDRCPECGEPISSLTT